MLRTHVERRTKRDAVLGQAGAVSVGRVDASQPKVGNFHVAARREENVLRFDVAVNDVLFASQMERRGDLAEYDGGELCVQRAAAVDDLLEVAPRNILLSDVVDAIDAVDIIDLHDVRVDERRGGLSFVFKSLSIERVDGQVMLQHFKGDLPLQGSLFSQIDDRHSTLPEAAENEVVADDSTRQVGLVLRFRVG